MDKPIDLERCRKLMIESLDELETMPDILEDRLLTPEEQYTLKAVFDAGLYMIWDFDMAVSYSLSEPKWKTPFRRRK